MRPASRTESLGRWARTWRRSRRRAQRHRRAFGAVLVGASVVLGLSAVAPPDPPTATMVVAARDIAAGVRLSSDDLATVSVPVHVVPQRSLTETAALGRILAGPLSTGEPLTATRLAGSTLLTGDPDAVALPVRVADPGATLLLSGGDRIDLLAVSPDGESTSAEVVASNLAVLLTPGSSAASAGGDGPSTNTLGNPMSWEARPETFLRV